MIHYTATICQDYFIKMYIQNIVYKISIIFCQVMYSDVQL